MNEKRLNPREQAQLEEEKKRKKTRAKYIAVGAALVLMLAMVLFVNSGLFRNGLAALKVGDAKYTVADVNYQYHRGYMQFTQTYGDYVSMFLDTSKPLSEQDCMFTDGGTWDDYFKDMAQNTLVENTAYYKAAMAEGYTLTDDERADIDGIIQMYSNYASVYGYDLDGYLAANFGAGNNEKTVRANMEREHIIARYLEDVRGSFEFSDAEKDAYYEENADTLDKVSYIYKYISLTEDENAEETAKAIAAAAESADEEGFREAVRSITDSEVSEATNSPSGMLSQYSGAVTKEELKAGNMFTYGNDSGWYVVYITAYEDNQYNTVSVRHILVKAQDTDGDGSYSDEEKKAAYDAIVDIRDEWLAADDSEEYFATLVEVYSEDEGSVDNGGLYEDIYKGQMVTEFDDFCFAGHKHGDYDIVYGESSSYAGYHLVYYVGEGDLYSRVLADNELRGNAYNEAIADMTEGLTPVRTFMWRYVVSN